MTKQLFKQQLLNSLYKPWTLNKIPLDVSGATKIVFGDGNPAAELMVVGEAPGREEDKQGKPFVGRSGQLLTQTLEQLGVPRNSVFITNTVKIRPPDNRTPTPQEIDFCKHVFLEPEIKIIQPKVILTLGAVALSALLPDCPSISRCRGKVFKKNSTIIIPTYHPAYILRNPQAYDTFKQDIQLAISYL